MLFIDNLTEHQKDIKNMMKYSKTRLQPETKRSQIKKNLTRYKNKYEQCRFIINFK